MIWTSIDGLEHKPTNENFEICTTRENIDIRKVHMLNSVLNDDQSSGEKNTNARVLLHCNAAAESYFDLSSRRFPKGKSTFSSNNIALTCSRNGSLIEYWIREVNKQQRTAVDNWWNRPPRKNWFLFMSNVHTRWFLVECICLRCVEIVNDTANLTVNDNHLSDEQPVVW